MSSLLPLRASRLGDSLPEGLLIKLDSLQARITGHSEAITFVLARGMMGFSIRRCGDSPASPIPPRPDEASPAAAPPPPRPGPSSCPEPRQFTSAWA